MNPKKILLVTRGFYPENSPRANRATELAKEFSRRGHEVTVLLPEKEVDYSSLLLQYPMTINTYPLRFKSLMVDHNTFIGKMKRKLGRLLFLMFEYPNIEITWKLKKKMKRSNAFDLMISIAVPHPIHWGIALARNPNNRIATTWVADCGDPYMGNTLESMPPPFYFSYFEKLFCRKADYISVPTIGSIKAYYPEFRSKFRVIPQGFSFDGLDLGEGNRSNAVPTFAYAGGLAAAGVRSPKKLIAYLLERKREFRFHVFSTNSQMLQAFAGQSPNIVLHQPVPRNELLKVLKGMDFLLNLDNGSKNQTPSKLIDYALTGRPILNIAADDPDFNRIDEFLEGNYTQRLLVENIEQHDIKNVASGFLGLTGDVRSYMPHIESTIHD